MKKYLRYFIAALVVVVARFIPFSWIVGSCCAYFSWSSMIAPVVGKYCGLSSIAFFIISQKKFAVSTLLIHLLHRLPLFGAMYTYKNRSMLASIVLPVLCIFLFIVHNVGGQAWQYSLYWFIPIILWSMPDNIVVRALTASFVAHAIGSVIWLYIGNISPVTWLGLIPVVFVERILIAIGIVVFDYSAIYLMSWYKKIQKQIAVRVL